MTVILQPQVRAEIKELAEVEIKRKAGRKLEPVPVLIVKLSLKTKHKLIVKVITQTDESDRVKVRVRLNKFQGVHVYWKQQKLIPTSKVIKMLILCLRRIN